MIMTAWFVKTSVEYLLVKFLSALLGRLSYRRISDTGSWAGRLFDAIGIRKKVGLENLLLSDLQLTPDAAKSTLSASYRHFGRTFFELLALDHIRLKEGTDYELLLPPQFEQDLAQGAVFVSAHMGNWELMGKVLAEKGIRLAVVVKRQYNDQVDRLICQIRERAGMVVVYDHDLLRIRRLIGERYCIALLSDQDFGTNDIPVRFLGRDGLSQEGPVFFARKFHLPVFFCFALRKDRYFHHFEIRRLDIDLAGETRAAVQQYTNEIEKIVRSWPSQWLWHHKRWKVHA